MKKEVKHLLFNFFFLYFSDKFYLTLKKIVFIIIIMSFLSGQYAIGQNNTTSRITMYAGGSLEFTFNSLKKYNDGFSYTSWTNLRIYFIDTTDDGTGTTKEWKLTCRANSTTIYGDYGNNLDLSNIELEATNGSGFAGATYPGKITLSDVDKNLITNGPQGTGTIYISYDVGTTTSLLGEPPDNYVVDIIFTLQPE